MTISVTPTDIFVILLALFVLKKIRAKINSKGRLPPGPRQLPIIGNLLDIPLEKPWDVFSAWGKRYGGLVSISMAGQQMCVINSLKVAVDLLEKRSTLYSDRAQMPSAEYIGYTQVLPMVPYGDRFRDDRKMLSKVIGSRNLVERFGHLQEHSTRIFLLRLLKDPEHFPAHIRKLTGESVLIITHGYQIKEDGEDPFVQMVEESADDFARATLPGAYLVDMIPALRYIPSWLPGGRWKKEAEEYRKRLNILRDEPHEYVKEQMAKGTALPSFASRNLEDRQKLSVEDYEMEIKWVNIALLGGGSDTTVSTMNSFFLAMTLYPEVQRKAQEEIDAVIGTDQLPTFEDRDRLPYVRALCDELLRWLPVGPLGVPHRLMEDDTYEGYYLPKGTIFLMNLWGMLHDPEFYTDPLEFKPDRYIASPMHPAERDPHSIAFGFGRRQCPGIYVVDATLFIAVVSILATFNIEKAVENGVPVTPRVGQTSGSISHPYPFKCSIKPRSRAAEASIRAANEETVRPNVQLY